MPDLKRIAREIRQCESDSESSVVVKPIGDDLTHLKGIFKGPEDTVYAGGTFIVDIQIPANYPFQPPKMKFDTMVYHPNISSQTGAICLDILKDAWTPVLTLKTALISLQSMLCDPAPNDPQDAVVARRYLSDRKGFEETAREWTLKYAMGGGANADPGVNLEDLKGITDMGFDRDDAIRALKVCGGDKQQALEKLLNSS